MPILENGRWELFAQALAKGETATKAYESAGYRGSRSNAARLRANEHIAARILEIQGAGAKSAEVTVASLIEELEAARVKATSLNQLSAAVRATAEKAKISGLLTQKVEVSVNEDTSFEDATSAEEVLIKIANELSMRAAVALADAFELPYDEAAIIALCNGSQGSAVEHARPVRVSQRTIEWQPPRPDRKRQI